MYLLHVHKHKITHQNSGDDESVESTRTIKTRHRLNMDSDLQSWAPCAQLYSLAETPQTPPPAVGLIYEGAFGLPR